ncbi:MAG: CDP-diacylglycerol--serine O-phosphatidyltransferase, partial [Sinobacterium sp.]|nr:CDP-diacylglycerol--serine O-phosphatidyltransferase [Sinobacterium sp.]
MDEKKLSGAGELTPEEAAINQLDSLLPVGDCEEEVSENGEVVTKKGVYLLPNLFTTAALFSGFYAVIASMQGRYEAAAIAIFVAMILDITDGRVARMLNAQSKFGAEYDSLSDMISFGMAPAVAMFCWALNDSLGKVGWVVAFVYVAAAALRLARFNTQPESTDKRYFTGLASPAAAAALAAVMWVSHDLGWVGENLPSFMPYVVAVLTVGAGILMVSNLRYPSFKGINFKARVPLAVIVAVIAVFAVVGMDPPKVLLFLVSAYILSGFVLLLK